MGVPALFRWLSTKYPKIISPVVEELPREIEGQTVPVDTTKPNPNGEEMDNLYLDMNGIVHPCTHPEGKPPPADEAEMMVEIFAYTDRVVNMVRPRKVLMIAVGTYDLKARELEQTPETLAEGVHQSFRFAILLCLGSFPLQVPGSS
jgi:5'-3' exoribonuclease 2